MVGRWAVDAIPPTYNTDSTGQLSRLTAGHPRAGSLKVHISNSKLGEPIGTFLLWYIYSSFAYVQVISKEKCIIAMHNSEMARY